jgi:cellulose synthase/poly-beta-1,6-N-acetylglucosamine synthase-like glycosyltransferase
MKLKEILFKAFNKGNNIYTCHGLARAYSKAFYRNLVFPVSVGNDMYGYLACISGGFKYIYVESVIAYYRLPEDINDHQKQSYRFLKAASQQCGYFGKKMVEKETKIPTIVYLWAGLKALPVIVRNPKDTISYLLMFLRLKNKQESYEVNQAWDMVVTSKNL